ncbi:toxin-antitoxin system HicB family antitoxin [Methyloprofundus sp.]|uniref:toxin-antitoxin system HicB family antitoxin n=1 Tax=Methyloprofundus sp. TaxID=2020875 RepID=UPI003D0AAA3E
MSTLSLRLPNSLHNEVKSLAKKEGISINQFISSAIAEKMSSLLTEEYLLGRSQKGSRSSSFLNAMSKVPDVEPETYDKL